MKRDFEWFCELQQMEEATVRKVELFDRLVDDNLSKLRNKYDIDMMLYNEVSDETKRWFIGRSKLTEELIQEIYDLVKYQVMIMIHLKMNVDYDLHQVRLQKLIECMDDHEEAVLKTMIELDLAGRI